MKKITSLLMIMVLLASCTSKAQKEETTLKEEAKEVKIELNTKEVKVEDLIDTTNKDYTYQIKEAVDTSKEGKQIVTVVKINNKTKEQEEIKRIVIVKSVATNTTVTTTPATNVSTSYEKRSETTTTPTTTKAVVKETTVAKEENKVKIPKTNLDTSNPYVIEAMNMVGESGNCGYITGQLEKRVIGDGKYVEYGDIQEWDESLAEIGDIVTYEPNGNSGHVAIYLGNGQALHGGVSDDKGAVISSINLSQYSKKYLRKKLNVVTVVPEKSEEEIENDWNAYVNKKAEENGLNDGMCNIDWENDAEAVENAFNNGLFDYCYNRGLIGN